MATLPFFMPNFSNIAQNKKGEKNNQNNIFSENEF